MRALLTTVFVCIAGSALAGDQLDDRDITRGQILYEAQCASCHGASLEGQPNWQSPDENGVFPAPPHNEDGHTWHHDNQLLFDYTQLGGKAALAARGVADFNSGMPAFQGVLTGEEIWDVLAYIRSTWPQRIQDLQSSRNPPHGSN